MFRKYNKKILTSVLVIVVGIGLVGPGILLIFAPSEPVPSREITDDNLGIPAGNDASEKVSTSSLLLGE